MDNAANNIAAMRKLVRLLEEHEVLFDPIDRCVPCFPHILNICVTHTVRAYTKADFTAVAETWVGAMDNNVDKTASLEALAKDPVTLGHDIVHIIHASGQHHKGFCDTIINGNVNQWYMGNPTQVPVVELLHDVKTRWDLIYFMINQLRAVRLVGFSCFIQVYTLTCLPRLLIASFPYLVAQTMNLPDIS